MTRSDLPHLAALPLENQTALVGALWRAWRKAEPSGLGDHLSEYASRPHPAFVSSCAEMVEAVLAALEALPAVETPT